jgi:acyl-CoA reductase-like NAD-dependent aldehyde dehydrogenase
MIATEAKKERVSFYVNGAWEKPGARHSQEVFNPATGEVLVNRSPFGNATVIFTTSGKAAREYSSRCEVGMVGVNVGVAAPMAFFPFAGWKSSFFGDLHAHGSVLHGADGDHEPLVLVPEGPVRT